MTSGLMGDDEGLLTVEEVAELLQLSVPVVRRLQLEGAGLGRVWPDGVW
jgi:hypothetical protein